MRGHSQGDGLTQSLLTLTPQPSKMTPQELGWLVVVSSMGLAVTLCLTICLSLWCR